MFTSPLQNRGEKSYLIHKSMLYNEHMHQRFVIGIDEVGRGPIAGPVCVGAFIIHDYSILQYAPHVLRDSKKLTPQKRDDWVKYLDTCKKKGKCAFAHSFVSAQMIDKIGISNAIKNALSRSIKKIQNEIVENNKLDLEDFYLNATVLLDGGLKAPKEYIHQQTIIKGDEKEPVIALASIIAKVARDKHMEKRGNEYPMYDFETHKGYGTKIHYKNLRTFGASPIHRQSFLG